MIAYKLLALAAFLGGGALGILWLGFWTINYMAKHETKDGSL